MRLGALPAPSPSLGRTARVRDSPKTRLRRRGRAGRDRRPGARRPGGRAGTDRQRHLRLRRHRTLVGHRQHHARRQRRAALRRRAGRHRQPVGRHHRPERRRRWSPARRTRFRFAATATPGARSAKALIQLPVDPYTQYLAANPELTVSGNDYTYTFTAAVDLPNAQVAFQVGGSADAVARSAWTTSRCTAAREPEVYEPDTGPRVRVNQVGYLPDGPEERHRSSPRRPTPLPWQLKDAAAATSSPAARPRRAAWTPAPARTCTPSTSARTRRRAPASRWSPTARPATRSTSARPSTTQLRSDALKFFYTQRSGIAILDDLRARLRPAGRPRRRRAQPGRHRACPASPASATTRSTSRGGWYDAGDHGKYVVNGGISVYQLMSEYERTMTRADRRAGDPAATARCACPESGNGVPDVLDEARWELEFLLQMQVPAGQAATPGMAHHKIHDANWTGLPLLPQRRPAAARAAPAVHRGHAQPRRDRRPGGAAVRAVRRARSPAQSLAAAHDGVGGGARPTRPSTPTRPTASAAAPTTTPTSATSSTGRPPSCSSDHRRAASTGTTCSPRRTTPADIFGAARVRLGQHRRARPARPGHACPTGCPDRARVRQSVVAGADTLPGHAEGAPVRHARTRPADEHVRLGLQQPDPQQRGRDGARRTTSPARRSTATACCEAMDYIFGRNALNQSYVTGYGEVGVAEPAQPVVRPPARPRPAEPAARAPWPAARTRRIQDPVAQQKLQGCAPQFCYIDDIDSWSTNELTINWNSPLAWIAAFVADQDNGDARGRL